MVRWGKDVRVAAGARLGLDGQGHGCLLDHVRLGGPALQRVLFLIADGMGSKAIQLRERGRKTMQVHDSRGKEYKEREGVAGPAIIASRRLERERGRAKQERSDKVL
jgi:hypothetical protein